MENEKHDLQTDIPKNQQEILLNRLPATDNSFKLKTWRLKFMRLQQYMLKSWNIFQNKIQIK